VGDGAIGLMLRTLRPDVVVGTGGYVSAGVLLAATLQRIPTLIHEQNAIPGRTNRLLARFVSRVALTFPEAARFFPARKTVLTGLPIRPEIGRADWRMRYARSRLGRGEPRYQYGHCVYRRGFTDPPSFEASRPRATDDSDRDSTE